MPPSGIGWGLGGQEGDLQELAVIECIVQNDSSHGCQMLLPMYDATVQLDPARRSSSLGREHPALSSCHPFANNLRPRCQLLLLQLRS